jgi:hypothetical protein
MIRLSNKYGRKVIFANIYKNNESTSVSTTQYLPNSQHTKYKDTQYKIRVTNIVTKTEKEGFLTLEGKNERGAYFSFLMTSDILAGNLIINELGTYKYTIYAMGDAGKQEKIYEVDRGLFHIFNSDTFEDNYINPSATTIPAVKVYKPA